MSPLTVTEIQGQDQQWLVWGLEDDREYAHTDSSGPGGLFYEAETRTPLGGASTGAVGGASGGNALSALLSPTPQAIMSTQAASGGPHLNHVGTFRVFARLRLALASTGACTVAWQWASGDFANPTTNAAITLPAVGTWFLIDLGMVTIPRGSVRWEGRLVASSTHAGDTLSIDYVMLIPATQGYGVVRPVVPAAFAPTSFTARDEFAQTAGNLTGKTAPAGGVWAGSGSATDVTVSGSGAATRAAGGDADNGPGRCCTLPVALGAVAVQANVSVSGTGFTFVNQSVIARFVDTNNLLHAQAQIEFGSLRLIKRVGGVNTTLWSGDLDPGTVSLTRTARVYTLQLRVSAFGEWFVFAAVAGQPLTLRARGQDPALATGGTLDDGAVGIRDEYVSISSPPTRTYDNFWAAVPPIDAAIFANRSLRISSDGVEREDASGAVWGKPGNYEGDYLRIPPSGQEDHAVRILVKACRFDPAVIGDLAIDDISAQVGYVPRYLAVPS